MAFTGPLNPQLASPLFVLPAEIRNEIFALSLCASRPILDPANPFSKRDRPLPPLGTGLLATCQRVNLEIDSRPLYKNDFVFTSPTRIALFLATLAPDARSSLARIALSMLDTYLLPTSSDGTPSSPSATQWLHYLTRRPCPVAGSWRANLPTLASSLSQLQHLTIDLGGLTPNLTAEMASMGIKTGYAAAISQLLRGLAITPSPGEGAAAPLADLRCVEVTGYGAHMWDLGDIMRPTVRGEWPVVQAWIELMDSTLIPALAAAVEKEPSRAWLGMLQADGNRFSLAAMAARPTERELAGMGYEAATSWEDIKSLTDRRERVDHPVFALFV